MTSFDKIMDRIVAGKPAVGQTPSDVVHEENSLRLLRYRPRQEGLQYALPVLLVPSLINRHYVLDLMPNKSFVEFLVGRGHDVFIIDWGTPGDEDRFVTFDDVCDRLLGRCVRKVCRLARAERVHLLGYCLGGTLTSIYAAAHPAQIASLVALAAPVSFHGEGLLSKWMRIPTLDIGSIVGAFGNMPWPMMQASFHMLKPTLLMNKGVKLIEKAWDDEFLDGFFAIETWGNDNVSFPGEAYRVYIEELYRKNALVEDQLYLSGRPVRLRNLTCPTLVITFADDYIVPHESASILVDLVGADDVEHEHLRGGHVGAVVSRKAAAKLWPKMSNWWADRDVSGPRLKAVAED